MKKLAPILIMVVFLVVAGIATIAARSQKSISQPQATVLPLQTNLVVSPIPSSSPTPSGYLTDTKSKARSEFVSTCISKGHYSNSECNCAADYLSKNYSETELVKMYIEYHSTSAVPPALEAAANVCVKK